MKGTGITFNEVLEMPAIEFLNELVYQKAEAEYMAELRRKAEKVE